MELNKIVKYLDKKFSPSLAAKWDNVGFQIFNKKSIDMDRDITKVLVCLDVNNEVINEALKEGTQLIVSRHPFIFNDIKQEKKIKREQIKQLTENDIYVFSIHTNYDASSNQDLLNILAKQFSINKNKRFGSDNEGYEIDLKQPINPEDFIDKINEVFPTDLCQVTKDFNMTTKVQKFFIVTGAGGSSLIEARLQNIVFVTGEMKWNEMVYANDNHDSVILKGHYMENYFVDDLTNKLSNSFKDIAVNGFNIGNQIKNYK